VILDFQEDEGLREEGRLIPVSHRPHGCGIIGASLMIAFRVLTMDEAIRSVNHETLILLFGMMIVVANLRLSGFFAMVSAWVVEHTHHPLALLTLWIGVLILGSP